MKKILSFIICLCILLVLSSCGKGDYIGIDKAKDTVVKDIGAAIDDVKFAVNDLITDDNGDYYELHFTKDGTEYVYEVDAMTGEILNKNSNSNTNQTDNITNNETSKETISMEASDYMLDNNDSSSTSNSTNSSTSM